MAATLATLAAPVPIASQARIASLDSVRALTPTDECGPASVDAQRDSLARIRQSRTEAAWPHEPVLSNDRLLVRRRTDVKVNVDPRIGIGSVFLAPELGRCRRAASALRARGIRVPEGGTGSYRFRSERSGGGAAQRERMVLVIDNGSAVVEWNRGLLSVFALGREIRDSGTVFAVLVDSAARRAFVYVLDGAVALLSTTTGALQAGPGGGFEFGPTGTPQPITGIDETFVREVRYHTSTVWETSAPRGFPWRRVGIAAGVAAGAAGAYYLWHRPKPKRLNGTVVIRIPL